MLAPLATLVFLATIWLVGTLLAGTLAQSGGKIRAALAGRSLLAEAPKAMPVPIRVSQRWRSVRSTPARPSWRAAA